MAKSTPDITKSRKRPEAPGAPIMLRLQPDLLAKVDTAAKKDGVTRPEAIRRLIQRSS